jgi:hypothetical protein
MISRERGELRAVERVLTACLVVLKLNVLRLAWGHIQGFDAYPWLEVFRETHWFAPVLAAASTFGSYHPPLSYLLCRLIYDVYPHELEATQIMSTLAMLGAIFAFRSTLKTVGILWTIPGLMLLYLTASIPVVVWLATETSYDPLVFMWVMLALALSVALFWKPAPASRTRSRRLRYVAGIVCLGLVLAAGLLTKFNTIVAFVLPFLVIAVRRGGRLRGGEIGAALVSATIGLTLVAPLYYERYYMPLHHVFPQPMEWLRAGDLAAGLARRNADPWGSWRHMLRVPAEPLIGTQEPVTDSFIHSIWLQIWKRDIVLGQEPPLALAVSDVYLRAFGVVVGASTLWFLVLHRRLPGPWRDLGYVLFAMSAVYCLLLIDFGWQYPVWDWRVFKAKYITPAMPWIAYAAVLPFVRRPSSPGARAQTRPIVADAVALVVIVLCLLPVLFMVVNHLLPVY